MLTRTGVAGVDPRQNWPDQLLVRLSFYSVMAAAMTQRKKFNHREGEPRASAKGDEASSQEAANGSAGESDAAQDGPTDSQRALSGGWPGRLGRWVERAYGVLLGELQSSNEELETSQEELQSVNDQLRSVNAELEEKVEEANRAREGMDTLLASTQIGIVFLDTKSLMIINTAAHTQCDHRR